MRLKIELYALATLVMLLPSLLAYTCGKTDADGDGYSSDVDCNDNDASIYPGAVEPCVCDDIDQNCNGETQDFPCDMACPVDADGDGYTSDKDCNDNDATIYPGAMEPCVCDNIDQNCNGLTQDFPCDMACPTDADGDGYTSDKDCNDSDPNTYPGATEPCVCDAIDQNCNGIYDDSPCMGPKACTYQSEGEACAAVDGMYCEPGLACCYPCGIPDCTNVCMKPCDPSDPYCVGSCPLYP